MTTESAQTDAGTMDDSQPVGQRGKMPSGYWSSPRRLVISICCLVVGLACLRLWWGYEAGRRRHAAIELFRAEGVPVTVGEIDRALGRVPEDQNAAALYEEAVAVMVMRSSSGSAFEFLLDDPPDWVDFPAEAAELVERNRIPLAMIRMARARPHAAWKLRLADFRGKAYYPVLRQPSSVAELLQLSAVYHHLLGDDAEVVAAIHDLVILGAAEDAYPALVYRHGLAAAVAIVERLGAVLEIEHAAPPTDLWHRPAQRAQVESLIRLLMDEGAFRSGLVTAFRGERALVLGVGDPASFRAQFAYRVNRLPDAAASLQWPLIVLDLVRTAKQYTRLAEASTAASWPRARRRCSEVTCAPFSARGLARLVSIPVLVECESMIARRFELLAARRMTSVALAIRLYEVDHGRRPLTLGQLVPKYLAEMPADPFREDGGGFRYKLDDGPARLYSIGTNGIDNGGVTVVNFKWPIRARSDLVFYLDGRPPPIDEHGPYGSFETDDDDENAQDDEWQDHERSEGENAP